MKLGIMGTGMIVQQVLPVILEQKPEKCFLMGREHSAERTRELAERYRLDGWCLSIGELLAEDIDTVYIALPNQLHYAAAKQVIAAGKHAFVEKPICACVAELDDLAAKAREREVFVLEAMSTPHLPAFCSLKKHLPELGEIRFVSFRYDQYSSRYDAFLKGQTAPAFDPACLGGALMDLNVYNIHTLAALFGEPDSVSYFPRMQRGIDTGGTAWMDYGTFLAEAEASKDMSGTIPSLILGERAQVRIPGPLNGFDCYEIRDYEGGSEFFDLRSDRHRMSYEFREFARIIDRNDRGRAEELLGYSRIVTGILDQARPYDRIGSDMG